MFKTVLLIPFVTVCAAASWGQTATTLSPQQIDALRAIKVNSEKASAPYAAKLAVTVKAIYANMLAAHEDQKLRKKLARNLHIYTGELLDIRGQSYRDALAILTPDQRQTVREALKKPNAPTDIGEVIQTTFGIMDK